VTSHNLSTISVSEKARRCIRSKRPNGQFCLSICPCSCRPIWLSSESLIQTACVVSLSETSPAPVSNDRMAIPFGCPTRAVRVCLFLLLPRLRSITTSPPKKLLFQSPPLGFIPDRCRNCVAIRDTRQLDDDVFLVAFPRCGRNLRFLFRRSDLALTPDLRLFWSFLFFVIMPGDGSWSSSPIGYCQLKVPRGVDECRLFFAGVRVDPPPPESSLNSCRSEEQAISRREKVRPYLVFS